MSTAAHRSLPSSGEPRHAVPAALVDLTVKRRPGGLTATDRDLRVAQRAQDQRLTRDLPMLGDYVRFPDTSVRRLSVEYGDGVAWQCSQKEHSVGFYLHEDGTSPITAGSHSHFTFSHLTKTDELKTAAVWMFSNGEVGPGRATYLAIAVRVWDHGTPAGTTSVSR